MTNECGRTECSRNLEGQMPQCLHRGEDGLKFMFVDLNKAHLDASFFFFLKTKKNGLHCWRNSVEMENRPDGMGWLTA